MMTTGTRARWRVLRLLGAALVVGGLFGLAVAALTPTVYTASATLFVASTVSASPAELLQPEPFAQQVVLSYAGVATTPLVLGGVIDDLGLATTPEALAQRVHVETSGSTIRIDATDPSPNRAAAIADSMQQHLVARVGSLTPSTQGAPTRRLSTVHRPDVPSTPSSPVWSVDVGVAVLAGGAIWGLATAAVLLARAARRPISGDLAAPSML